MFLFRHFLWKLFSGRVRDLNVYCGDGARVGGFHFRGWLLFVVLERGQQRNHQQEDNTHQPKGFDEGQHGCVLPDESIKSL